MSEKRELSRAELVRARRVKRNHQAISHVTSRSNRPLTTVTSRTTTQYVVRKKSTWGQSRRLFNLGLGLPHITFHNPGARVARVRDSWRVVSALMVMVLGGAMYLAWTLPELQAQTAIVHGNARLSSDEINAVLNVSGRPIFLLQPRELATSLRMNYPELTSVEVKVGLPNLVTVNVSERQPVILWQQGDGFTWIDSGGVAFRPRGLVPGLVPVIGLEAPSAAEPDLDDPLSPPRFMRTEMVEAILTLAPKVPPGSTLTFDPNDGLGWADPRGWEVYFGLDSRDMPLKVQVYQSLVETLEMRGTVPEYINVSFPDAPYYRQAEYSVFDSTIESGY